MSMAIGRVAAITAEGGVLVATAATRATTYLADKDFKAGNEELARHRDFLSVRKGDAQKTRIMHNQLDRGTCLNEGDNNVDIGTSLACRGRSNSRGSSGALGMAFEGVAAQRFYSSRSGELNCSRTLSNGGEIDLCNEHSLDNDNDKFSDIRCNAGRGSTDRSTRLGRAQFYEKVDDSSSERTLSKESEALNDAHSDHVHCSSLPSSDDGTTGTIGKAEAHGKSPQDVHTSSSSYAKRSHNTSLIFGKPRSTSGQTSTKDRDEDHRRSADDSDDNNPSSEFARIREGQTRMTNQDCQGNIDFRIARSRGSRPRGTESDAEIMARQGWPDAYPEWWVGEDGQKGKMTEQMCHRKHILMNKQILACKDAWEILDLCDEKINEFNQVNTVTAFHRIAKFEKGKLQDD